MRPMRRVLLLVLVLLLGGPAFARAEEVYEKDVAAALSEIGKQCATLIEQKKIDWKAVAKEFGAAAKATKTDQEHYVLLVRLLARLEDGHAAVRTRERTQGIRWPAEAKGERFWSPISLCRIGKKIHVESATASAREEGILPGSEVVAVEGVPAAKWLEQRAARWRDFKGFSTDQHAFSFVCHPGLAEPEGTKLALELRDPKGVKKKASLRFKQGDFTALGPAVPPADLAGTADVRYGRLPSGHGYVHVARCPGDLPEQIDAALAAVGTAPGIVLDFRGNAGGGFDHDALMGRFVPKGETLAFAKSYASAGPHPYAGPVVVIVDGLVVSAGETASGQFKEDGRAYVIGESPTAGMSSQKTEIELPSGLFALYVSIGSNKGRFNGGKGIEGIGVAPHEIVEHDPAQLAAGVDTLIARAVALLADFPANKVPYRAR
jgi:carboxyl-terminal processing protease